VTLTAVAACKLRYGVRAQLPFGHTHCPQLLVAEDEVMGLKTRAQVIAATKRGTARMDEIDQLLNVTVSDDPLAALVTAPDPVKAWKDSPLANQQVAVDRLCTVTILPVARRGQGFVRPRCGWIPNTLWAPRRRSPCKPPDTRKGRHRPASPDPA
jgi:hypothetical protein